MFMTFGFTDGETGGSLERWRVVYIWFFMLHGVSDESVGHNTGRIGGDVAEMQAKH